MIQPCIILVNTFHPGNIGSVARAMKTMGLSDLRLVNPKNELNQDTWSMAAGAQAIAEQAQYFTSLASASLDLDLLVATSADQRKPERPMLDPEQSAKLCLQQRVGLVFGGERDGLSLAEIRQCSHLCHIPGNPDYGVLNLSHAVQILAWESRKLTLSATANATVQGDTQGSRHQLESLLQHWQQRLQEQHFLSDRPADDVRWQRLRSIMYRQMFSSSDLSLFNGFLRALSRKGPDQ